MQGYGRTRTISDVNHGVLPGRHGHTARVRRHEFGLVRPSDVLAEKHPRGDRNASFLFNNYQGIVAWYKSRASTIENNNLKKILIILITKISLEKTVNFFSWIEKKNYKKKNTFEK